MDLNKVSIKELDHNLKNTKVILIGGSNIDYIATPFKSLIKETSNIGKLKLQIGGVMKNVASSMKLVNEEFDFLFITAIGNDINGELIKKDLDSRNIKYLYPSLNNKKETINSSSYLAINDENNDLFVSICDNEVISYIDEEFIDSYDKYFLNSEYIVIDTNLDEKIIKYIVKKYKDKKIIVEGVSSEKILKIKKYLKDIYLLKCNFLEIKSLLKEDNIKLDGYEILDLLITKYKLKNAIITNKSRNILIINHFKTEYFYVKEVKEILNSNGVGDALFAGFILEFIKKEDFKESVKKGDELAKFFLTHKNPYQEYKK